MSAARGDDDQLVTAVAGSAGHSFRVMQEADLPQVLAIERQVYEFPWTEGILRDCIRIGYYCCVSEADGGILAYGILSSGGGESHILNLCVHPVARRQGLGFALLHTLMDQARRREADCILLEVRPSNRGALGLYQKAGFNEIGVRKAYYPARKGREDALIYALEF